MASTLLRFTRSLPQTRHTVHAFTAPRTFTSFPALMAVKVDTNFVSRITAAEKTLTNSDEPVKRGPTARAQSHVGQDLNTQVVHDITEGEKVITGSDRPVQGGPTSVAQSILTSGGTSGVAANVGSSNQEHSGRLDSDTLSKITDAEKKLTGEDGPVRGGPTAQAQSHAKEPITSEALHDITEGEKKITGGERVKGGPTSQAQSELGKSRQN
uniref:SMP domain-containing protein n=1 Tax=Picea sitchensis TaxID=3332 RepID=A9P1B0_PICSI|nr:unknown [Picea sitchensis]